MAILPGSTLGMLSVARGKLDAAAGHFEAAIEVEREADMAFAQVLSEVGLAGVLLRRGTGGDAARAQTLLSGARETVVRIGLREASPLRQFLAADHGINPFDSGGWRFIEAS